jgi:hypothetical protein
LESALRSRSRWIGYLLIAEHLQRAYRVGGSTDFDLRRDPRFQILVPAASQWAGRDPVWRLPCHSAATIAATAGIY